MCAAADFLVSVHQFWRTAMPLDSILVAIAVTMMFATVAAVIRWGDRQTRNL
jgi:hypothetical protein